ncbi:hypothetical protein JCM5350_004453 [Sporobolomyces pararoseus]
MSGNPPTSTAPLAAVEQPATSSTAPLESADGVAPAAAPLTKSALKKLEKEKALAAKKALKQANNATKLNTAAPSGEKKEKKEKVKKEEVQEEPPYKEVPEGEKKDLSNPMASGYNPTDVEKAWYTWWKQCQFFVPAIPSATPSEFSHFDPQPNFLPRNAQTGEAELDWDKLDPEKTFVIPAPPPNVTGSLHIGHALAFGLQDTLIRWHRMRGFTTLFVPGYDHAGISTQSVVEKRLAKTEGLSRHDLGREKFLERCMAWKEEYQGRITNQICRLGVSCDWDRVAFTMNPALSKAVAETFVRLHDDGIIYRANRLVNWCVAMNTTLSNLEVDQKNIPGRTLLSVPGYDIKDKVEFGVITSFAYPLEGSDEKIVIATTRPETLLGDTAIAVHPDDERYTHLHGKFAIHPFLGRRIPIITDSIAVDKEFGTGAVKMTPAHDPNDYEVGMRHKLEFINILNDDGTLNSNAGPEFEGMKRFHARKKVIEEMKKKGLYVGDAENPMQIPVCAKSGDVIESVMKPQWWVSQKTLAEKAIERTRAGELKIRPAASEGDWYRWLEGIQDWCISRQLWWGHRAPAYFVNVEGVEQQDRLSGEYWVTGRTEEEARQRAEAKFSGKKFTLEQDEDVLDTWFSSGLWPFSIQGWPDKTPDLKHFYPASVLETGWDILFFWVARMVLLGIYLTDKMPFNEVFCHAMIRDAHGRKMSKSLGNVIDPIDVIEGATLETLHQQLRMGNLAAKEIEMAEKGQKKDFPAGIPQCGTDALRFALCNYSSAGRDINLEILRVEGYRKFCNKLWNATKFAMLKLEGGFVPSQSEKPTGKESLVEKWILHKLNSAAEKVNSALNDRNFMAATSDAYSFWLYEICDVYIEAIKLVTDPSADAEARLSAQNTLYTVLDNGLRLLHPFMPFVTEELWQRLPRRPTDQTPSIMLAKFPEADASRNFPEAERDFDVAFNAIRAIRSSATGYNLNSKLQVFFHARNPTLAQTYRDASSALSVLIKGCTSFTVVEDEKEIPVGCVGETISPDLSASLLLKGVIDAQAELNKAEKKRTFAESARDKLVKQRSAPDYSTKRPADVQAKEAEKVKEWEAEIDALTKAMENFKTLM